MIERSFVSSPDCLRSIERTKTKMNDVSGVSGVVSYAEEANALLLGPEDKLDHGDEDEGRCPGSPGVAFQHRKMSEAYPLKKLLSMRN